MCFNICGSLLRLVASIGFMIFAGGCVYILVALIEAHVFQNKYHFAALLMMVFIVLIEFGCLLSMVAAVDFICDVEESINCEYQKVGSKENFANTVSSILKHQMKAIASMYGKSIAKESQTEAIDVERQASGDKFPILSKSNLNETQANDHDQILTSVKIMP